MSERAKEIKKSLMKVSFYSMEDIEEIVRLEAQYDEECEQIAQEIAEEGGYDRGADYDLRCANARRYYDEQIALIDSRYEIEE